METPNALHFGTGGWEHESFDACFYPRRAMNSIAKLAFYATFFDATEVRATFWDETLSSAEAREWINAVADNKRFVFIPKLHSLFTHKKILRTPVARNLRSILALLAKHDKLGMLLAQFPYSFTNTSGNRYYVSKMRELFRGFPVAVEFRHDSWNQSFLPAFLEDNDLVPVNTDLPAVNHYRPFHTSICGSTAYIRLHGRNERGWLTDELDARYDYLYNGKEIKELSRRVAALQQKVEEIILICNNTTGGKAVANALQVLSAIRHNKPILIPQKTMQAFPQLERIPATIPTDDLLIGGEGFRQAM